MHYVHVAAAPRHDLSAYATASVESDHCLGRLLQRAPGADLGAALQQARDAFLAADRAVVTAHLKARSTFYLPAGPGILLCKVIRGVAPCGRVAVFARANTLISDAMIRPDQVPIAPAVGDAPSMLMLMSAFVLKGPQPKDSAA